jgi:pumilio RNA-binding family
MFILLNAHKSVFVTVLYVDLLQVQGQYQVIPAYYDQNGSIVMGNVRGIGNGTPMRLVSPAPVIVNATGTPGSNMRLLGNQPQQIATPPAASIYNNNQQPSLYNSTASNGTTISGKFFFIRTNFHM